MLDNFSTQRITWNKANNRVYSPIKANSGDTNGRTLEVQILNGGTVEDLTGKSVNLAWRTKDGAFNGLDVFEAIDATKGMFKITYTTGMLSNVGVLSASIVIIGTNERIESSSFTITVERSNVDDTSVQSENSFTSLTTALAEVQDIDNKFNNVNAQLAQKATRKEVDDKVSQIVSGTPRGAYPTLSALQSAYPNGNDGVYVVTENGHWYYWFNSQWTSGGIYQGAAIDATLKQMVVESFVEPITNIVTNGDFSNGTSGWTLANLTLVSSDNNELTVRATNSLGRVQRALTFDTDDLIYRAASIKSNTQQIALGAAGAPLVYHSGSGNYERISDARIRNIDRFISVIDTRSSNWDDFSVKYLLSINLTKTFGKGKEPTKGEMDELLSFYENHWFNGTIDRLGRTVKKMDSKVQTLETTINNIDLSEGGFNPAGAVAITFDDGFLDNYTHAHPALKARGLPATIFVTTKWVMNSDGTSGWCSPEQLLEMQNEGWEIGSHSVNHENMTNMTDEQVHYEGAESKRILKEAGFNISTFALPFGAIPVNQDILFEYYDSVAQSGNRINTLPFPHRYIYRYWPHNGGTTPTTVDQVMEWIRQAEKRGGIVVLGFHRFGEDQSANAWSLSNFEELLDRLDANKVFTFRDIAQVKPPSHKMKVNKAHYRWGHSGSGTSTGSLSFPIIPGFGWDYLDRSLGLDLRKPKTLDTIRVKCVDSVEPVMSEETVSIWYSNDNNTFTRFNGGFNFHHYIDSVLEDTRRSILITIKNAPSARYWKFHQNFNNTDNKTKVDPTNAFMDVWVKQRSIDFR